MNSPADNTRVFFLIPVNGLANRLRAMASAFIWTYESGYDLRILWQDSEVMACSPEKLFGVKFIEEHFINTLPFNLEHLLSRQESTYYFEANRSLLYLAGGRRGEQELIEKTQNDWKSNLDLPKFIVMKSGGLFHECKKNNCQDCEEFQLKRQRFYRGLDISEGVSKRVKEFSDIGISRFISIHLRLTDKPRHERVSIPRILRATNQIARFADPKEWTNNIAIFGDEEQTLNLLYKELQKSNFRVWRRSNPSYNRRDSENTINAFADWIIMSESKSILFHGNTSFSYEAAVRGGLLKDSVQLQPRAKKLLKFVVFLQKAIAYKWRELESRFS
jgi:hypothetical protein